MSKTPFEQLHSVLKAHPHSQPIARPRRGRIGSATAPDDAQPPRPPSLERHRRKCKICRHPDREAIEIDFLRWRPTSEIAKRYRLADHSSICRHARATGLLRERDRRIGYALHPILERADEAFLRLTPNSIISAVTAYARINDDGTRYRPRPINNFYYVTEEPASAQPAETQNTEAAQRAAQPTTAAQRAEAQLANAANRPIPKLEGDPTR